MQNPTLDDDHANDSRDESAEDFVPVPTDTDILQSSGPGATSNTDPLLRHLQVGATVYSSDGQQVAVVEDVRPGGVGVRAAQPGRPIDVPVSAVAGVSQDGQRLDLRLSSEEVERLAGGDQPGYAHLQAQHPQDVAELANETPPSATSHAT